MSRLHSGVDRVRDARREGWNAFVDDDAGLSILPAGNHTVTLAVTGGDGCVEIDVVTLSPRG
jgi:hypothetical protein